LKNSAGSILAWHPDRLARNSVDGGRVIYLLDTGKLASFKFPTFWCDSTPRKVKFMLNMAFGQSKYYVDSLSENTKRGLRQKVRNGDYPSQAPVGYIKRCANKNYHRGQKEISLSAWLSRNMLKVVKVRRYRKLFGEERNSFAFWKEHVQISCDFYFLESFYIGLFKYGGERHEGKYEPIISKKLFDRSTGNVETSW
jgi:site-specific DNA recombinase